MYSNAVQEIRRRGSGGDDDPDVIEFLRRNDKSLSKLFSSYADDESKDEMTEDGLSKFCSDIEIDIADIAILYIAWKMQAKEMGRFSREEFYRGCAALKCTTVGQYKSIVATLPQLVSSPQSFKAFYMFVFELSRTPGQRGLSLEYAKFMWELLLQDKWEYTQDWLAFLETRNRTVTRDEWNMTLTFMKMPSANSFQGYDDEIPWPTMMDDFVDWYKENRGSK